MNLEHIPQNPKYKFVTEWDTNISVPHWVKDRQALNKIINAYNEWQIDGFKCNKQQKVLALIEFGYQTFAVDNEGYLNILEPMEAFVRSQEYEGD